MTYTALRSWDVTTYLSHLMPNYIFGKKEDKLRKQNIICVAVAVWH